MEDTQINHAPVRKLAFVAAMAIAMAFAAWSLAASPAPASAYGGGLGLGPANDNGNGNGGNGGNGSGNTPNNGSGKCRKANADLGKRTLKVGSCGGDVVSLHWFFKARKVNTGSGKKFANRTESSVMRFQRSQNLKATGIVDKSTVKRLKKRMKRGTASWYGKGFYGGTTACGQKLRKKTVGVAVPAEKLKKFPCGSRVLLNYKGRWVRAKVIDTGGFGRYGRDWDLTERTAKRLNKNYKRDGVFKVRTVVQKKKKKKKS